MFSRFYIKRSIIAIGFREEPDSMHETLRHDDVIAFERLQHQWSFHWGIYHSPLHSSHKEQNNADILWFHTCYMEFAFNMKSGLWYFGIHQSSYGVRKMRMLCDVCFANVACTWFPRGRDITIAKIWYIDIGVTTSNVSKSSCSMMW